MCGHIRFFYFERLFVLLVTMLRNKCYVVCSEISPTYHVANAAGRDGPELEVGHIRLAFAFGRCRLAYAIFGFALDAAAVALSNCTRPTRRSRSSHSYAQQN